MLYINPLESRLPSVMPEADMPKERRALALREFEHLFLYQLLREMRKTVPKSGLLGSSPAHSFFEEQLDDHFAEKMAESGQLGIAREIDTQLRLNERI
jgi:flagellar protein FlgJ